MNICDIFVKLFKRFKNKFFLANIVRMILSKVIENFIFFFFLLWIIVIYNYIETRQSLYIWIAVKTYIIELWLLFLYRKLEKFSFWCLLILVNRVIFRAYSFPSFCCLYFIRISSCAKIKTIKSFNVECSYNLHNNIL